MVQKWRQGKQFTYLVIEGRWVSSVVVCRRMVNEAGRTFHPLRADHGSKIDWRMRLFLKITESQSVDQRILPPSSVHETYFEAKMGTVSELCEVLLPL